MYLVAPNDDRCRNAFHERDRRVPGLHVVVQLIAQVRGSDEHGLVGVRLPGLGSASSARDVGPDDSGGFSQRVLGVAWRHGVGCHPLGELDVHVRVHDGEGVRNVGGVEAPEHLGESVFQESVIDD